MHTKAQTVHNIVEMLEKAIQDNWLSEPEDVKKLRMGGVQGAYRHISTAIFYAESETREMVDYLWHIKGLLEQDKIDLNSAKVITCKILDLKQDKWIHWYRFEKVPAIIKHSILGLEKTELKEDFLCIIELLQIFIGKINFWLDSAIPWLSIASVFDFILHKN